MEIDSRVASGWVRARTAARGSVPSTRPAARSGSSRPNLTMIASCSPRRSGPNGSASGYSTSSTPSRPRTMSRACWTDPWYPKRIGSVIDDLLGQAGKGTQPVRGGGIQADPQRLERHLDTAEPGNLVQHQAIPRAEQAVQHRLGEQVVEVHQGVGD